MIKDKKAFEFSFGWIFAVIVGAVFIFLAIYASMKLLETQRNTQDTELGKKLGIILTPLETSLETGKRTSISMPIETRIYNECNLVGAFGQQKISTATKSEIGNKWESPGIASTFQYKYIFSDKIVQGKEYTVFSKPFEMPFKVSNLIFIWSEDEEFCFIDPPGEIEDEITDLNFKNIHINNCSSADKTVCFQQTNCDIDVSLIGKSAKHKFSDRVYFETTPLLYAAIFSSPEIYECQIKRLMKRTSELSSLYASKSSFLAPKGCSSNLEASLIQYANKTSSITDSIELKNIFSDSENLRRKNENLDCKLF